MHGRRLALAALCGLLVFSAAGALASVGASRREAAAVIAPAQMPLQDLLGRVQARYRSFDDWSGRFRQARVPRPGARPIVMEGTWYVKSPGRLRMEYDDPARLFVADGEQLFWYLPDDNQVQILPQNSLDPSRTPTLYLAGEGDLYADFLVSGTEWEQPLAPQNLQMRLDPRAEDARFTHLVLEVDPSTELIARLVWFGLLGESSELRFFELQIDSGLAEELFQFTIPADAQVEHLGN